MSTSKKPVPGSTLPETPPTHHMVPRSWLIALTLLLVVPWLVVGALYLRRGNNDPGQPAVVESAPSRVAAAGPWGTLSVTPIVISPPMEFVIDGWGREPRPLQWFFPQTSQDVLNAFLGSSGLSSEQMARLQAAARPHPAIGGFVLTPDAELLRGLSPEVRAKLYVPLARSALNIDQAQSFRYAGATPEDWLGRTMISLRTREIVEPLIYRHGSHLYFADVDLVRAQISDPEELRRLAKALLRQSAMMVRLSIENEAQVRPLAEYWGRGGRRTDIRPLLESIVGASQDRSIDIVHLLPSFAREHLYRYPKLTAEDLDRPILENCLWSALNFFNTTPDDRYRDINVALQHLKQDYFIVENSFELGDVVALLDEEGDLFHLVVHLADGLVFTKNGTSPVAPWVILPLETVKDYYSTRSANPRLIYHRRKDL